jgi:hypothetical protein
LRVFILKHTSHSSNCLSLLREGFLFKTVLFRNKPLLAGLLVCTVFLILRVNLHSLMIHYRKCEPFLKRFNSFPRQFLDAQILVPKTLKRIWIVTYRDLLLQIDGILIHLLALLAQSYRVFGQFVSFSNFIILNYKLNFRCHLNHNLFIMELKN